MSNQQLDKAAPTTIRFKQDEESAKFSFQPYKLSSNFKSKPQSRQASRSSSKLKKKVKLVITEPPRFSYQRTEKKNSIKTILKNIKLESPKESPRYKT